MENIDKLSLKHRFYKGTGFIKDRKDVQFSEQGGKLKQRRPFVSLVGEMQGYPLDP